MALIFTRGSFQKQLNLNSMGTNLAFSHIFSHYALYEVFSLNRMTEFPCTRSYLNFFINMSAAKKCNVPTANFVLNIA